MHENVDAGRRARIVDLDREAARELSAARAHAIDGAAMAHGIDGGNEVSR
jgi:hypothetical protein